MTITEFNNHNKNNTMPCEWIGQGYGYKLMENWDDINDDDIIYIPEYAYEKGTEDGKVTISRGDAYSKNDFKKVIRELDDKYCDIGRCAEVDRMAAELFDMVDWQYPESLAYEMYEVED